MNDWPLNDPQFMPAITACLVAIAFGFLDFSCSKTRVRRAEFARLQRDVEEISGARERKLQAAEQLRFLKENKVSKKDGEGPSIIPSFLNTA